MLPEIVLLVKSLLSEYPVLWPNQAFIDKL